jgi:hypothetical protein
MRWLSLQKLIFSAVKAPQFQIAIPGIRDLTLRRASNDARVLWYNSAQKNI